MDTVHRGTDDSRDGGRMQTQSRNADAHASSRGSSATVAKSGVADSQPGSKRSVAFRDQPEYGSEPEHESRDSKWD